MEDYFVNVFHNWTEDRKYTEITTDNDAKTDANVNNNHPIWGRTNDDNILASMLGLNNY
jgi:hypothetical protein